MDNSYSTSQRINYGSRILPIKKISLFSPDEWEEFIEEWLDIKESDYIEIDRFGGAGDMGRDVVAYKTDKSKDNYKWDCYQCKHYKSPLMPSQVYAEFGKIIYYTFKEEFPVPEKFYFVGPLGVGTTLSNLLSSPDKLKASILKNWSKYCTEISKDNIKLDGDLLEYFDNFDFSIFEKISVKSIVEEHRNHSNHLTRFGGGLPDRERLDESAIPEEVQKEESTYVNELYNAYGSHSGTAYNSYREFETDVRYIGHFKRARISFHHAEQLRNFSRDSLPAHTFEDFQNEILAAVIDIVESEHDNGFVKVKEVEKEARSVVISSNPLKDVSIINDRSGVCHQLANDEKVKWS